MFASLLYTQRDPNKISSFFFFFRCLFYSSVPAQLFLSILSFFKLKSPPPHPPCKFSQVFAYIESTPVHREWKQFQHHVCCCFFLYTCARVEMGSPSQKGEATRPEYTTFVCVDLQYTYKGIAHDVATATASLAAYLQLFHSHDPILHHRFFRYFRSLLLLRFPTLPPFSAFSALTRALFHADGAGVCLLFGTARTTAR